jgi:precorrin-6B methylase 2
MTKRNAVVATCKSHDEAEAALKALQQSGFEMKQLSIVGRDHVKEEHVVATTIPVIAWHSGEKWGPSVVRFWDFWLGLRSF